MKTICFVVPQFPTVSQTFIVNQIVAAKKQGYAVCVLTSKLGTLEQSSQGKLLEQYQLLKDTMVIDYQIPKTKLKQLMVGLGLILKYFKFWIQPVPITIKHRVLNWPFLLQFYAQLKHIEVFHVQFALGGVAIAEMKANGLLKAKLITTFHGHDAHYRNATVLTHLQKTYKTVFKVSNYITVNTPFLKKQVLVLGCRPETLKVVPMGIDVAYFKPRHQKTLPVNQPVKLISVGRFIAFKGFKYAIKTIKIVVDKGINVHYTLVGEGPLLTELQQEISALNLQHHVTLVGRKNQEAIRELLDNHEVFLMSSVTDATGRCETQGVVTAEAQAMGLPVVAFNSGGVPYTIHDGETGILVKEKDVDRYAQAILEMINDSEKYQAMSVQAREFAVANFSNELMLEHFMSLYEN